MAAIATETIEREAVSFKPPSTALDIQSIHPSAQEARPVLRALFKYVNSYFMVPAFRLGLGWAMGSPHGGYIMLLKTTGKKSGKARYAPVNYAILGGNVYCIAGWGRTSHWFANMEADPHVELLMPGGAVAGIAEEVTDLWEARRAMLGVLKNAGFAAMFAGLNPRNITYEQLAEKVVHSPVVRIRPVGVGSGPYDPGGWGWVLPNLAQLGGAFWLIRRLRHRRTTKPAS